MTVSLREGLFPLIDLPLPLFHVPFSIYWSLLSFIFVIIQSHVIIQEKIEKFITRTLKPVGLALDDVLGAAKALV